MKLQCKLQQQPIDTLVLGFFDGLHIAHKNIINTALSLGGSVALVTFSKSPLEALQNNPVKYIATLRQRIQMFKDIGLDYVYMLDFKKVMNLEAHDYLKNYLVKNFRPKNIITGFNHRFGARREGGPELLEEKSLQYGYNYLKIGKIEFDGRLVSSTNIKYLISQGRIEEANTLLGKYFSITGQVIKGNQMGRTIGFPTANILWKESIIQLSYGVYFGDVIVENKLYRAIINYGCRDVAVKEGSPVVEAHILNFDKDIYGKKIAIFFERKIRDEMSFKNFDELKTQIQIDLAFAKNM